MSASAVGGVGYYAGGGSDETRNAAGSSYYTTASAHGEPPGRWSGALAEALGLRGEVTDADLYSVFEKFTAPDGTPIGRAPGLYASFEDRLAAALAKEPDALPERVDEIRSEVERSSRSATLGMDLTFSPAKSVTVAHAAAWRAELEAERSGDLDRAIEFQSIRLAIEGALLEANAAGIEYATHLATSRAGKHGSGYAGTWVRVEAAAVASFFQHTSRANDPQLHVHNVMLNRGLNGDGQIRALDNVDLGHQRRAFSTLADRVLAERLADLGLVMEWRRDGKAREVVGVDEETMALFSQRRAAITKALAPAMARAEERLGRELNGLEKSRLAQTINLVTRASKGSGDVDWSAMLDQWQDRLTEEAGRGLVPLAERLAMAMADGAAARDGSFSREAVVARALYEAGTARAAFTRADLFAAVDRALPLLGLSVEATRELIESLTDEALATTGVVQVSGNTGIVPPADLVHGAYVRPSDAKWAAPVTLAAEDLIRQAAVERRGHSLSATAVDAWLTAHYPTIGADQRAAVLGLATSDAALAQLIGPPGTGKSYAAGALAGVWSAQTDGVVHGLTVGQNAAQVLAEDGVVNSANIAAWMASQVRLEEGRPDPAKGDLRNAVGPRDVILVDEASMVGTGQLDRIRDVADSIGARIVLMGDPAQLGPVTAGNVMELVGDRAETYTLSDVRRFSEAWEGAASLALRDGRPEALLEYDRHGRLVEVEDMDAAIEAVARAAAADRLAGHSVAVMADTNDLAARIANAVRGHMVEAGRAEDEGVTLVRSETVSSVAGIGDEVITRHIDYGLGVLNGDRYTVIGTGEDGSLSLLAPDGSTREVPADYVAAHVQLGYGATVHVEEGKTVDVGYVVTDGRTDAAGLLVGLTRGRDRNTAVVATRSDDPLAKAPGVEDDAARPSARSVLEDILARREVEHAARVAQQLDADRLANMGTILEQIEHGTDAACRARLEGDLDRLVEDGVLSEEHRAALGADQSTGHLSRVIRAAEQAGLSPAVVLREAVEERSLANAKSVAQVLSARITTAHDVSVSSPGRSVLPERLPEEWTSYLASLHGQGDERAHGLGSDVAREAPAWAVRELGPVPDDAMERLEWESRAGAVAAYREAAGYEDEARALPSAPGLSQTEHRAAWWGAWDALGRPQETRVEAALSDGALYSRVAAWTREQAWAPAHADASLKHAELSAANARTEHQLAVARGDDEAATFWADEVEHHAAVTRGASRVADARAAWAEETAVTRDLAERAADELRARGQEPGQEPDRLTAEEWLAHQQDIDQRDEAVREVTDLDVPLPTDEADAPVTREDEGESSEDDSPTRAADVSGRFARSEAPGTVDAPPSSPEDGREHTPGGGAAVEAPTPQSEGDLQDDGSQSEGESDLGSHAATGGAASPEPHVLEATTDATSDAADGATASAPPQEPAGAPGAVEADAETSESARAVTDDVGAAEAVSEPVRSAAHDVAPIDPDDVELDALVAAASTAEEERADRASQEAAHAAWEAEQESTGAAHASAPDVAEYVGAGAVVEG